MINYIIRYNYTEINFDEKPYIISSYGHILIIKNIVRIGPSVTVYWVRRSFSEVLQWDWIFVEARLKQ
jgi:hypothetical protein